MSTILEQIGLTEDVLRAGRQETTGQAQVKSTFGYKWAQRDTYDNKTVHAGILKWLVERYCAGDIGRLDTLLAGGRKVILDAGCGSALSASLLYGERLRNHDYVGLDISEAVEVAKVRFKEMELPGEFVQWSLTDVPIKDESVDMIFSEGVLTFTESTSDSISYLTKKLKKGGTFLFYVYKKKGPIREFADDHIRHAIAGMGDEEAWKALMSLSQVGEALGKLNAQVEIPSDVPYLGITKGTYDVQRFFYWFVCKAFYRPDYSLETMNMINFDWYRPIVCHRHTDEEVKEYCERAGLDIEHYDTQEAGITVVARKR